MKRIIILNEDLETQMRMYLALSTRYKVEIAEDEAMLMRMIRRKKPRLIFLDEEYSGYAREGRSITKTVQKIKKKYTELQVISVLNSHSKKATNSDFVLYHPFNEMDVQKAVQSLLELSPLPC
ncbi:MAG: hypothetical protein H6696_17050 [Deferribacteres bacterium]|nr:hypothetical protein [candidate division KSB1 bacterium]MCB9503643.1 hypothetical protein [Deferribacteres bacterium]